MTSVPTTALVLTTPPAAPAVGGAGSAPTALTPELKARLGELFAKCVKGYHHVSAEPIKESPWENINAEVLAAAGCAVTSKSSGSHKSGSDITCALGDLSNKSAKYDGKKSRMSISSYRLTTVCSPTAHGTAESIVAAIDGKKDFQYYSVVVYSEKGETLEYDWYMIPADHPALSPASYEWRHKTGKIGPKKGEVVGWETNEVEGSHMSITYSMSSQLWIHLAVTPELRTHIVGSCTVSSKPALSYLKLGEMFA